MVNGKDRPVPQAVAYYDFYKTNGQTVVFMPEGPSMTRQEFKDEADINVLMKKYEYTGIPPALPGVVPQYVDFTAMPNNLMDTMQMLSDAEAAFMQLPASVRKEFDNSAYAFVDFASDPANVGQMQAWGLAPTPPVVENTVVAGAVSAGPPTEAAVPVDKPPGEPGKA